VTDPTGWKVREEAELRALSLLTKVDSIRYQPDPAGALPAREALCRKYGGDPEDWVLTASTSEAYSVLFQLLADPGESCAVCRPSYPLLDDLARHGGVKLKDIPLRWHRGEWKLDLGWTEKVLSDPRVRFVSLIQPGNPTGWWMDPKERRRVVELCTERSKAIICDEVFAHDLHLPGFQTLQGESSCLCFVLGGLSKSLGLPHLKLGWIRVSGPSSLLPDALERLHRLNDGLLSASTPVQMALGGLFGMESELRAPLDERIARNLEVLTGWSCGGIDLLTSGGGWVRILRLTGMEEEDLALRLLEEGVLVQPGYLYDLPGNNLVVSLLTPPDDLLEGLQLLKNIYKIS
jgi:aspartate/methionine/tyrosine aminotransferase